MFIIFVSNTARIIFMLVAKLFLFGIIYLIYSISLKIVLGEDAKQYVQKINDKKEVSIYESLYILAGSIGMIGSFICFATLILNLIYMLIQLNSGA